MHIYSGGGASSGRLQLCGRCCCSPHKPTPKGFNLVAAIIYIHADTNTPWHCRYLTLPQHWLMASKVV